MSPPTSLEQNHIPPARPLFFCFANIFHLLKYNTKNNSTHLQYLLQSLLLPITYHAFEAIGVLDRLGVNTSGKLLASA